MPFLAAAAVLAASYGAGLAVTAGGRLGIAEPLLRNATVLAAGYGALSLLALLLGVTGAFEPVVLGTVVVVFAVPGALLAARELRGLPAAWQAAGPFRPVLAAVAAVLAFIVFLASAPPTSGDALGYHLTAPKLWLQAGELFPIWWDWATFQPFSAELLFAYGHALEGGRAAAVVGALLAAYSALCVYGLGRALAGPAVAAFAALIWVGQGMFVWEATGAFVELPLAAFVALAGWHLVALARTQLLRHAAFAGLAVGLGLGTKYHALVLLPVLPLLAALVAPRRLRLPAAAISLAPLAVALPWYVKNWVVAGNPLYPLLTGVFGGRYWDAADARFFQDQWIGYGTDLWKLPIFPLSFLLETEHFERGYSFSLALFALAPVAVALGGRRERLLGLGVLAYVLVWWFAMHQITRYLLPILPVAAVLAAQGGMVLWGRRGWARRAVAAVAAATAAVFAAITGLFAWQVAPGALGLEDEGAFVQRLTGTYEALDWLERELPPDGRVLVIGVRNLYYLDRPYVRLFPPLLAPTDPTAKVIATMREYDVRYVAWLAGRPDEELGRDLRLLEALQVPRIGSRTLGRVEGSETLRVYAWCAGPRATLGCG